MTPSYKYPITLEELQKRCPLVTVESTTAGLVGKQNGTVVMRSPGRVDAGTIRKFQQIYNRMEEAGLFIPRKKENPST